MNHFILYIGFEGIWSILVLTIAIHIVGYILFGISTIRVYVMPRAVPLLLIIGVLLFFTFNSEDSRAWFALPFGATWGVLLGFLALVEFKKK